MSDGLDAQAVALAGGLSWGFFLLAAGLLSMVVTPWQDAVNWIGQFYLGYASTVMGSLIGAVWGVADVGIGLYLFCWLYNYFHTR